MLLSGPDCKVHCSSKLLRSCIGMCSYAHCWAKGFTAEHSLASIAAYATALPFSFHQSLKLLQSASPVADVISQLNMHWGVLSKKWLLS